jgi:hypothetical protein
MGTKKNFENQTIIIIVSKYFLSYREKNSLYRLNTILS